jgi:general secretion pathway protein J
MRRDAGYTLLEMMVALVVFGLIMAGIAQSFRFGLIAWSAGPRTITQPENMAAVDAALARMIGQALPGSMAGRPDGLAFTTALPPAAGLPDRLADVALMTTHDGTLILRYGPHPAGVILSPLPPPRIENLVQGVAGMSVSYLTPQPGGPVWAARWLGKDLPLLIRLHIRFRDGRDWPDLVAAPVDFDADQGKAPAG